MADDTVQVPLAELEVMKEQTSAAIEANDDLGAALQSATRAQQDIEKSLGEIAAALDALLEAEPPVPVEPPVEPPVVAPAPELILERSAIAAPERLADGQFREANGFDGVLTVPPVDGKYRKILGADATEGKNGGLCIEINNKGEFSAWVDDGAATQTIRIGGLIPGATVFWMIQITDGSLTPTIDGKTSALVLPAGRKPCDGAAWVGQGIWGHMAVDPLVPPDQPDSRVRVYIDLTDEQAAADREEWKDLLKPAPGGGNGGSVEPGQGLEPVDSSLQQVALSAKTERQTVKGYAIGLGSPDGQSPAATIDKYGQLLWGDTGAIGIRINRADAKYNAAIKNAMKHGAKWVHVTGYDGPGSAKLLSDSVKARLADGIPVVSCALQNEPDFKTWTDAQTINGHKELRSMLPSKVAVVSPEFANCDSQTYRCADLLRPLMPDVVQLFGHHSYGNGQTEELSKKLPLATVPIAQFECGYLSVASTASRMLNDLNRGCAIWTAHRAHQTRNTSDAKDQSQSLIAYDGKPFGWYYTFKAIAKAFPVGTKIRQVINGASADTNTRNMHWRPDFKSSIYAAVGQLPDGRFVVGAFSYSGGKKQVTIEIPGTGEGDWEGSSMKVGGVAGRVRFKVDAGKLVILTGGAV
jgi:hypothetical protein